MSVRISRPPSSMSARALGRRGLAGCVACLLAMGLPMATDASTAGDPVPAAVEDERLHDGAAPRVTSARLEGGCASILGDGVYVFVEEGPDALGAKPVLSLVVSDEEGLASVEVVDPSGRLSAMHVVPEGARELALEVPLGDKGLDRSLAVVSRDLAGNTSEWRLSPSSGGETNVPLEVTARDGSVRYIHPRRVVVGGSRPSVSLSGVEEDDRCREAQVIRLDVSSDDLWMVRACEPDRPVARVVHTTWDGTTSETVVHAADLRLEDASMGAYSYSTEAATDGLWSVEAQVTGASGLASEVVRLGFLVDATTPEVSISFADGRRGGTFGSARTALVEVTEGDFDPALVDIDTTGLVGRWVDEGERHRLEVAFADEGDHRLRVTACDRAGNLATASCEGFRIDLTAPNVSLPTLDVTPSGVYGGGATVFLQRGGRLALPVADAGGLGDVSSLEGLTWQGDFRGGEVRGVVRASLKAGMRVGLGAGLEVRDCAGNLTRWRLSDGLVVPDGTRLHPHEVVVDDQPPEVDLEGPKAGSILREAAQVTLEVSDETLAYLRELDPTQRVLVVRRTLDDDVAEQAYPLQVLVPDASGTGASLGLDLAHDGRYDVRARVVDPAGNVGEATLGDFTVDRTAPSIDVSYEGPDLVDGRYCPGVRTATVVVAERNFDPALVDVDTTGEVGGWSTDGNVHRLVVRFGDGVHHLAVSCHDLAGNEAQPYAGEEFVVDTRAPVVGITGVADGEAYGGVVAPVVRIVDDAGLRADSISYELVGARRGEVERTAGVTVAGGEATIAYDDFPHEAVVDDVYTLRVGATDLAGNEASSVVTFSVNRFGSTFRVLGLEVGPDGMVGSAPELVLEEVNVCGADDDDRTLSVTHATRTETLERTWAGSDVGYWLQHDVDRGWSVCRYLVPAGNFRDDGAYHVVASSRDRAGNSNLSADYYDPELGQRGYVDASFVLDTTPPTIGGLNLSDGAVYGGRSYQVRFSVADNVAVGSVSVLLDGEVVEPEGAGEGVYRFDITAETFTPRSVEVRVSDRVGHVTTTGARGFRVTSSRVERHLPGLVILGGGLGAGVFGMLGLARRRVGGLRKRDGGPEGRQNH